MRVRFFRLQYRVIVCRCVYFRTHCVFMLSRVTVFFSCAGVIVFICICIVFRMHERFIYYACDLLCMQGVDVLAYSCVVFVCAG